MAAKFVLAMVWLSIFAAKREMKILLLGSGGREHAFAQKLSESPRCNKLFIAPGNAGTANCGENVNLNLLDFASIENFCQENKIDLLVCGPEEPLVKGLHDYFLQSEKVKHIPVIGPKADGAQLEGSKSFSKAFMQRHHIPTAAYDSFDEKRLEEGINFICQQQVPVVLKADGLAAGKGVLICATHDEACAEFKEMLSGKFGGAGARVVVEQFLTGIEFSVFVLTDGKNYVLLPEAKDYKRIGEGDTGLNTGGMGAISPVPFVNDELMKQVTHQVIEPTMKGLIEDGIDYKGFIYVGLMKTHDGIFVIEYNCRMGDPETEVVIPRLQTDLVDLFEAVANGTLDKMEMKVNPKAAVTIVLASGGYPGEFEKGKTISGFEKITDSFVFHAGTKTENGEVKTNGGRVMAVTSLGNNLSDALKCSNRNAELIIYDGKYFRRDIGFEFN